MNKERTRLPAWQEKSLPVRGVCFATATKSEIIQEINPISCDPLILVSNFKYCCLTLRTGLVHFECIAKTILINEHVSGSYTHII